MDGAGGNPGAGGGFDPCECINSLQMTHQRAMARLTDMLRNAQTTCTDAECFTGPLPGAQNTDGGTSVNHMFLMLMMWLAIAFLLFFFRPRALRPGREQQGKPSDQDPRPHRQEPPEPGVH